MPSYLTRARRALFIGPSVALAPQISLGIVSEKACSRGGAAGGLLNVGSWSKRKETAGRAGAICGSICTRSGLRRHTWITPSRGHIHRAERARHTLPARL